MHDPKKQKWAWDLLEDQVGAPVTIFVGTPVTFVGLILGSKWPHSGEFHFGTIRFSAGYDSCSGPPVVLSRSRD